MLTVSHKQAKEIMSVNLQADIITFLQGSPAMGKSALIKQLAKEFNCHLIDLRLTQLQPYDLAGLVHPITDKFEYLPYNEFILENQEIPDNKDGILLFLDEFNSADKYTAAAAYKLLLDRMVGQYKLHPKTRIICAGNKASDRAIVHNLGTAIQSRVSHLELSLNNKEWLEWLDTQSDWNDLIYSFLNFRPELISTFNPKSDVVTYASPRTWEFLSKQLNSGLLLLDPDSYTPAIIGTVGEEAGRDFISFIEIFSTLPSLQEIVQDPVNTPLPDNIGAKWALGLHIAKQLSSPSEEDNVIRYLERIPEADIRTVTYRNICKLYPNIKSNQLLFQSMLAIRQQLAR